MFVERPDSLVFVLTQLLELEVFSLEHDNWAVSWNFHDIMTSGWEEIWVLVIYHWKKSNLNK